jgi:hypothetical protein
MSAKRPPKNSQDRLLATLLLSKYAVTATALAFIGIMLTALANSVLLSTPLTALGISTILTGIVTYAIAKDQTKIPAQASAVMLESGIENISALIEEIGLKTKAIYLPSSLTGDKPKALIPLDAQVKISKKVFPKRLIVKYGSSPRDVGLLVITPGSEIEGPGETKQEYSTEALESAFSRVLVDTLRLADKVNVFLEGDAVRVEVINPRLEHRNLWVYESIGTPIASIAASVTAEITGKPVTINQESAAQGKRIFDLKILELTP